MSIKQFDREEARDIIGGDHEDYAVARDVITDTSRWSSHHQVVVEQTETHTFWQTFYSRGLTECQDEYPFDDEPVVEFQRVEPVEVTTIEYQVADDE